MSNVVAINHFRSRDLGLKASKQETSPQQQNDFWISCLIDVAKNGNQMAFQRLFQHFAPKIKTFLLKQGLNVQEAEELMQETFISVWRYADYFEANKGQVSTWIYTIARNKKLDYFRKSNRQVTTTEMISEDIAVESGNQFSTVIGDEIKDFLPQLPPEQVEVITKVYFEELSHQKAADALNITLGTVKGRIRSAINNLNKLMRGDQ
ncbi:RNA polymerase sigma factor [Pleionea litopenaei]|uniref:Sigma-70 family RNA polymerase sigma factor n=1 Tax=Pleionea litopenaei TaxID=3070815 RepID=A0AA51X7U1_9GAMM|nr:sigma-70 family RNA polymerase sigma factor [Pleionea sp. HL-JVS1]WMS88226.1 sigma-70 family RNA polymerase sigma factor [Pleionea sp. HL-JVS1]